MRTNFNTLRPRQNGRHFPDDIFKCIWLNENVRISIEISLKFIPTGPINNISALIQIMAWRRSGDKPLFEAMVFSLLTHICVTRPQWVKEVHKNFSQEIQSKILMLAHCDLWITHIPCVNTDTLMNMACRPGGHWWDHYPDALSWIILVNRPSHYTCTQDIITLSSHLSIRLQIWWCENNWSWTDLLLIKW